MANTLIACLGHHRLWAVGPLLSGNAPAERGGPCLVAVPEVMVWLDRCEADSVVYVSFGSQAVLSPQQATAIAAGLEKSGARFVWVGRGDMAAPEEFEEKVVGRGQLLRGWAPQVAILNHPAVGAFVTHCGWNSVMEAMSAGVVMLTWPLGANQFTNTQLVEEAGVGVRVCGGGERAVPDSEELARAAAEAVGEAGRRRRERAKALAARTREETTEGGSSHRELERLVEEVPKLVLK